jgi:hypothetical protein
VTELISEATTVRVAVAYWGKGSFERLDIENMSSKDITIVCDLMSGACNPDEVEKIQEALPDARVLRRDHLHAKVWLTDHGAIVGSSNMSANGLGFEENELSGSVEANVYVLDDAETLAEINEWFDNDVMDGAKEIKEDDLTEAKRRWDYHRSTRPWPPNGTLLEELRSNPASPANRKIYVWVAEYEQAQTWAQKLFESERDERRNNRIDFWQVPYSPNVNHIHYVFDFGVNRNEIAGFRGICQLLSDTPVVKGKSGYIILYKKVRKIDRLTLGEKKLGRTLRPKPGLRAAVAIRTLPLRSSPRSIYDVLKAKADWPLVKADKYIHRSVLIAAAQRARFLVDLLCGG